MHGNGTFDWAMGDSYSGEWVAGLIHGAGCKHYAEGGYIQGTFEKGQAHGFGTKVQAIRLRRIKLYRFCHVETRMWGTLSPEGTVKAITCLLICAAEVDGAHILGVAGIPTLDIGTTIE